MNSNGRHIVVPILQVTWRGALSGPVGSRRPRLRGCPKRSSSEGINHFDVPFLVRFEEGVQVLKVVNSGRGVDVRPVKHGKRIPGPGSSVLKRSTYVLEI